MSKISYLFSKEPQQPKCRIAHLNTHGLCHQPDSLQTQINFKLAVWTWWTYKCTIIREEKRLGFFFLGHRTAQITKRKCKHFYGWVLFICIADNLWFSMHGLCEHSNVSSWREESLAFRFSFQMAGLLKLWHGKVSVSRDWALFQSDIANNIWFISNM